mmetsp:Transcript_86681/g.250326  ORF Transcript_86681/g.250326 Transcript_86681/m.250326 type:complete len:240 (+) Transcript_86681:462-1181(+)
MGLVSPRRRADARYARDQAAVVRAIVVARLAWRHQQGRGRFVPGWLVQCATEAGEIQARWTDLWLRCNSPRAATHASSPKCQATLVDSGLPVDGDGHSSHLHLNLPRPVDGQSDGVGLAAEAQGDRPRQNGRHVALQAIFQDLVVHGHVCLCDREQPVCQSDEVHHAAHAATCGQSPCQGHLRLARGDNEGGAVAEKLAACCRRLRQVQWDPLEALLRQAASARAEHEGQQLAIPGLFG